jgi:membrane-bound ClpP family serine protease
VTLLGLLSGIWAAMALAMITVPVWWRNRLAGQMARPLSRLLWGLGIIVAGLTLIVGTSAMPDTGLWAVLGVLAVLKGMVLLGLSDSARAAAVAWWQRQPVWADQIAGVTSMALATLLAIDLIRAWR